jgi:hypothetical protein
MLNKTNYPSKNIGQPHKKYRVGDVMLSIERRNIFKMPTVAKDVLVSILAMLGCYGS